MAFGQWVMIAENLNLVGEEGGRTAGCQAVSLIGRQISSGKKSDLKSSWE
jgi:hypothetical protein